MGHFVVGGDDRLLKVFSYNEGELTHIGQGHSDNITAAAVDPFQRYIVSVTASGSIFRWAYPHDHYLPASLQYMPSRHEICKCDEKEAALNALLTLQVTCKSGALTFKLTCMTNKK